MRKLFALVAMAAASLLASPALAAATLVYGSDGTTVTGVNNLVVGTNTYNVSLSGGHWDNSGTSPVYVNATCAGVFGACSTANFAFHDADSALAGANALLSVIGAVATNDLGGCGLTSSGYGCYVITPFAVADSVLSAEIFLTYGDPNGSNSRSATGYTYAADGVFGQQSTFAKFSLATAVSGAVPEPATWAMMLLGFGAIGFAMRRRRTAALITA